MLVILSISIFLSYFMEVNADCSMLNYCNGHGACDNSTSTCQCYEGYGAASDVSFYKAPDCSQRTCPSDRAWADLPTSATVAHSITECSNRGTCDRLKGECKCMDGFSGTACQRNDCPNQCSGHGVCLSMKQLARMSDALPLAPNTHYEGNEDSTTWDEDKIMGCLCDSSWQVGLGSGETQEPEWFGPDCSLRHCPSGDNPKTGKIETDCFNVTAKDGRYMGEPGNLCQVDCSDQGICDHKSGTCQCFNGHFGNDCSVTDPTVMYSNWEL